MDFFDHTDIPAPEKGVLLISDPFLPDSNFERSVVLLCEHNAEGSLGFVLNKQSNLLLSDMMADFEEAENQVFIGGPVEQNTLHFIHKIPDLEGSICIQENLYWGGDFEHLKTLVSNQLVPASDIRFFIGYSGWSEGQLQREIEANGWIVHNRVRSNLVFDSSPEELWKVALQDMGGRFKMFSNYPADPRLN
ncbi:YqgE/AlgH family protein [Cytophagales bacterium LB-30]|uniref:YqgE/AlgH family protein n=2 Tax=Shiella aurantiaca TaxID=3058365 RepID=A0ABT8F122_9BACT|nr:YqgE/AlgH family protein [Shiella aurantiaca]